ncbi:MAG: hypothetical protein IJT05_01000 [Lachnospiraceae bacterium]|nr:hypothetical protein [Lachnospiraceae bacterium]
MFTLRNPKWKPYIPILVLFVVILVFHLFLWEHPDLDTARFFARVLKKRTLLEFLLKRYDSWSSRLVIEGFLVLLAKKLFLWKLLDSLLFPLLAASLAFLLNGTVKNTRLNWLVVGAILMYPFGEMQSAGWTATTMNYFWPLVLGIFSCTAPAVLLYHEKRPKWWHTALAVAAAIYACNMEQMCGVLFFVYIALFVLILKKQRKISFETILLFAADVMNLILILLCPGNGVRMVKELETTLTEGFQRMSLADKVSYALNDTCTKLVDEGFVFLVVTVALFLLLCMKTKSLPKRLIALFAPFLALYRAVLSGVFPSLTLLMLEDPVLTRETGAEPSAWAMCLLWFALLASVGATIFFLSGSRTEGLLLVLLFFVGVCSRLVVGLSPSLENSTYRTFIYLDFILLFVMLWNINRSEIKEGRGQDICRLMYGGAAVFQTVNTFVFSARLTL